MKIKFIKKKFFFVVERLVYKCFSLNLRTLSERQLVRILMLLDLESMQEQLNSQDNKEISGENKDIQSPAFDENIEEVNNEEIQSDMTDETEVSEESIVNYNDFSEGQLVEAAKELMASNPETYASIKGDMEAIKHTFYRKLKTKRDELFQKFIEDGGKKEDFAAPANPLEDELKEILNRFKEKRNSELARAEAEKQQCLEQKKQILDSIKELLDSEEDFGAKLPQLKKLQQEWKEVGPVPASEVNALWKTYQLYVENFYDNLKINNELRDYDFRKNLEQKVALCEQAEKLSEEKDVLSAFRKLQTLHEDWREIGPVSRENRESIWTRFKEASTVVNKRHHDYFDQLRSAEQENLEKKKALCEKLESIDLTAFSSYKEWQEKSEEIIAIQEDWKKIGFAPKKDNVTIYERFRTACDNFFKAKNTFFKSAKEQLVINLNKKIALCEKAEALKDSKDWKQTSDVLVQLQKDWKTIGAVPKKQSDIVWNRFVSACDYFFQQKNLETKNLKSEQEENLKKKKALIEQIKSLEIGEDSNKSYAELKSLIAEWNEVGHVPFKDKDKLYKAYKAAIDEKFDKLNLDQATRRMDAFKSNLQEMNEKGQQKLFFVERKKLLRQYETIDREISTYENNIGFFSSSSKNSSMIKDLETKIQKLKKERDLLKKQIKMMEDSVEQN